jgi:hypothetical protein
MTKDADSPLLLTRKQTARLIGVSERGLVNLENRGVFTPIRLGASVRHSRADIESAIERMKCNPTTNNDHE